MGSQVWHIVMVFILIGVFFNILARPQNWTQFLSGTFGSLVDTSKGIAGIR